METFFTHAHTRWHFALLLGAFFLIAVLVNRFRPTERRMLRRATILVVFALLTELLLAVASLANSEAWVLRLGWATRFVEGFLAINLGAGLLFDLVLFAVGIELATIVSDLTIGLGYIVVTLGTLGAAGVNAASVVGASAVVSAILALSLQSTLGNVIGGVALQLDGSFQVGDWLQLENGRQGKVKEIRWRHTVLETRDWGTLIVPNSSLLAGQILVLGKREGQPKQHRLWVYFNVDFRYPPSRISAVINEALQAAPIANVAAEPKPHCICMDFASPGRDSFGYYAVRYWLTDLAVDDPTSSAIRTRIHAALRRAQIPFALPATTNFFAPGGDEEEARRTVRHRNKRRDALKSMSIFQALTKDELESMVDGLMYAPFCVGETITRQGNVAHWLYVLVTGQVEIRFRSEGGSTKALAKIDAPGVFGEMGLMTGEPRAADVVALSDVECYRLDKTTFERVMRERPEIAAAMSKILAERRMELVAARDGLNEEERKRLTKNEEERILSRIREFFALDGD